MNRRRGMLLTALILAALCVQFFSFQTIENVAAASRCNQAAFVADVTVRDGTTFPPGAPFVKTWRLKNIGTCAWTGSYSLVFTSGSQLGAPASAAMPASVAPGQVVDITVDMKAPTAPGSYRGYWMLKNASGVKFGIGTNADKAFWVDIKVASPPAPPTATPSPTRIPPAPKTAFDFAADICSARWMTGASLNPQACPFSDGDSRGFVLRVENPTLENGVIDSGPGLLVAPQNKYNGYIQGFFPEYTVQPGDRFQASVGCAYGYSCYVTYRLDYQINNGPIKILWQWSEKNEGKTYQLDKDLSSLAGKKARFILTLLAAGPAANDRAIWGQPRIVNAHAVTPTPTSTPEPPKVTAAIANVTPLNANATCGQPNPVGVSGSITVNGPTAVTYHWVMGGDRHNTTADQTVTYSSAGTYEINEGAYKVDCGNYTAQLVITSPNALASEIFHYSIGGKATNAKAFVEIPPYINCAGGMMVGLVGEISADGPALVTYHWEVGRDGMVTSILPESTAYFTTNTTLNVSDTATLNCGNYFARLVVTRPNALSAQVDFPLSIPTLLPIYDFDTFIAIGAMACGEIINYAWSPETCNGESGGCWVSAAPLFGQTRAGFLRHDGITICGLNLP